MDIRDLPEWKNVHDLLVRHNMSVSVEVGSVRRIQEQNESVRWGRIEDLHEDSLGIPPDAVDLLGKLARRIRRKFLGSDLRAAGVEAISSEREYGCGLYVMGDANLEEPKWLDGEETGLKIEVAETLKSLEDLLEEADYKSAREHLLECQPDFRANIDNVVKSLREEDEFALMCRLMGTCTSIVRLDQKHVIPGDYSVPDFLASFAPGCDICGIRPNQVKPFRCFIDVKSRYNKPEKMKITTGDLERLRNYVRPYDLPLVLAVRFTKAADFAFWVMVEDADPNLKQINIPLNAYSNGIRQVLWNEKFFQVMPGLKVRASYNSLQRNGLIQHLDHGYLSHLTITGVTPI